MKQSDTQLPAHHTLPAPHAVPLAALDQVVVELAGVQT